MLTLHEASLMLDVSGARVRSLITSGHLIGACRFRESGHETIRVPRPEVERLARDGWPGRKGRRKAGRFDGPE